MYQYSNYYSPSLFIDVSIKSALQSAFTSITELKCGLVNACPKNYYLNIMYTYNLFITCQWTSSIHEITELYWTLLGNIIYISNTRTACQGCSCMIALEISNKRKGRWRKYWFWGTKCWSALTIRLEKILEKNKKKC